MTHSETHPEQDRKTTAVGIVAEQNETKMDEMVEALLDDDECDVDGAGCAGCSGCRGWR